MHILNQDKASTGRQKTVVVLGLGRGGTSMVAGVLAALGVYMGRTGKVTHEDKTMWALFNRADWQRRNRPKDTTPETPDKDALPIDLAAFDRLVAQRNAAHDLWGWKLPALLVPELFDRVRNPHLIAVLRDPVAIAARRAEAKGMPFVAALTETVRSTKRVADMVAATRHPCLVLSYEKALRDRETCVDAIIGFLGVEVGAEVRQQAIDNIEGSPRAYREQSRNAPIVGALDDPHGAVVRGWLRDKRRPEARLEALVLIDGELVGRARADKLRRDLVFAGQGDGRHGFEFAMPDRLLEGREHLVEIRVEGEAETDVKLNDNPRRMRLPGEPG